MLSDENRSELKGIKESLLQQEARRNAKPQVKFSLEPSALEGIRAYVNMESKKEDPFHIALSRLIILKGFTKDSDFYKKCGLTRQTFSKIMGWRRVRLGWCGVSSIMGFWSAGEIRGSFVTPTVIANLFTTFRILTMK